MESRSDSGFYGGIILLTLGTLFLLDNMQILDFGHVISTFWPVILIIIGIHLILKVRRPGTPQTQSTGFESPRNTIASSDKLSENNLFGDVKLKIASGRFKGGSISNVFGDIVVDLSDCTIESGLTRLNVNGVFGDVTIYLPAGSSVKADCSAVGGDITVEGNRKEGLFPRIAYQDESYAGSGAKLDIYLSIVFGSIRLNRK